MVHLLSIVVPAAKFTYHHQNNPIIHAIVYTLLATENRQAVLLLILCTFKYNQQKTMHR
uniref:Uncharacterized protein n=1 Tax=Rhizophora mucronata TaxID=61149 RepID=A0A2P2Q859_RHIMU